MPLPLAVVSTSAGSIRPDPASARSWLERELSRPEYSQSLVERLLGWLGDRWDALQAAALGASPLSTGAAVLLLVVLAVLVVLVAGRVRRAPPGLPAAAPALGGGSVTAQEHRRGAEAAMAAGDHDRAVVEAFRTIAARAVERGLLDERPGRTARELAADLGPVLPGHADELGRASGLFDLVYYGHRSAVAGERATTRLGGRSEAQSLLDLDDALRETRPAPDRIPVPR
jgi:Domain of unknown function (DUF4129)